MVINVVKSSVCVIQRFFFVIIYECRELSLISAQFLDYGDVGFYCTSVSSALSARSDGVYSVVLARSCVSVCDWHIVALRLGICYVSLASYPQ